MLPCGIPLRCSAAGFAPLLLFPARAPQRKTGETFDLFYGMLVFRVLAVLVLRGAGLLCRLAVPAISNPSSRPSLTVAGALLVVAWGTESGGDFSGIGSAICAILLSPGMPLEQWLVHLSEESERNAGARRFLEAVMQRLAAALGVGHCLADGRQAG